MASLQQRHLPAQVGDHQPGILRIGDPHLRHPAAPRQRAGQPADFHPVPGGAFDALREAGRQPVAPGLGAQQPAREPAGGERGAQQHDHHKAEEAFHLRKPARC
jgi:hypothetical protein